MNSASAPTQVSDIFKQTAIWQHFTTISSQEKITMVQYLLEHAIPILDRITETFPTYTLHNGQHQLNILNLYEKLLGPEIKRLNDLESAILILSAFYHDIGMVFKQEDRQKLEQEENFDSFLRENDSAMLQYETNGEINPDLAEWYCRWSHSKRVWAYLNELNQQLVWEGNNIREELAQVCLSHNEDTAYIKTDSLNEDFWNHADLKLCAILLRLADILDFDNTRSPESVFTFLGLNNPKNKRSSVSQREWEKHLASKGFDFSFWSQDHNYSLGFRAAPNHPAVETDIKEFLDIIELELQKCSMMLRHCSSRWQEFKLPEKITRDNIRSQGYSFGEFKFSLDQREILNLLMGENLYSSPHVFLRELLQNAIDTSRHRNFHEKQKADLSYNQDPITITSWYDDDSYRWIRIDDYGMGMTLNQISKYFLKVGNSYYNSDEFKVRKLGYKKHTGEDFTPVSRFGIGILSCFMVGDVIEVNTRSINCDGKFEFPVRLSIEGINNYFFLYTKSDLPKEMPSQHGGESQYRSTSGTSIAIRIKPNHDTDELNLDEILKEILFQPPIDVIVNGRQFNSPNLEMGKKDKVSVFGLDHAINQEIMSFCDIYPSKTPLKSEIHVVPLSIRANHNIRGTLYIILFRSNLIDFFMEDQQDDFGNSIFSFRLNIGKTLRLTLHNRQTGRDIDFDITNALSNDLFKKRILLENVWDEILLSHNGIIIPSNHSYFSHLKNLQISIRERNSLANLTMGYLALGDEMRPNVSIARDGLKSIQWLLWSHLNYTISSNLQKVKSYNFLGHDHFKYNEVEDFSQLAEDRYLLDEAFWPSLIKPFNSDTFINFIKSGKTIDLPYRLFRQAYGNDFLLKSLVEYHSNYHIKLYKRLNHKKEYELITKVTFEYTENKKKLSNTIPPFIFCKYVNFSGLMPCQLNTNSLYNSTHLFSNWLKNCYSMLNSNYPNFLKIIENSEDFEEVNKVLKKLKKLLPDDYKPDFVLKEEDFEVDMDSLEEIVH